MTVQERLTLSASIHAYSLLLSTHVGANYVANENNL